MTFKSPQTGRRAFRDLGRLATGDVPEALIEAYREIDPAAVREDGDHIRTVGDLLRAWLFHQEQRGPGGALRTELQITERSVKNCTGGAQRLVRVADKLKLSCLTTRDVLAVTGKLSESYAPRTIKLDLRYLAQAMNWGRTQGLEIPQVDFRAIKQQMFSGRAADAPVNNHHTPPPEDVEAVYRGMRRRPLKLGLLIAWKTGARVGEVAKFTWGDLHEDDDGHWIWLDGKTGRRRFPLTADDAREIAAYRPHRVADTVSPFSRHFEKASGALVESCKRRGVEPFTFHGLRRLMSDTCHRAGVEVGAYAALLGHSAEEALRAYRQPTAGDLRSALRQIRGGGRGQLLAFIEQAGISEGEAVRLLTAALEKSAPEQTPKPALRLVVDRE